MNKEQMLAAVLALPDPDLMFATRIEDGPGDGAAYKAKTVVRLLAKEQRKVAALQTAAAALLALDLENDGNTSGWSELQAALAGLRKALKGAPLNHGPAAGERPGPLDDAAIIRLADQHGIGWKPSDALTPCLFVAVQEDVDILEKMRGLVADVDAMARERCAKLCESVAEGLEHAEEDAGAMSVGAEACAREIRRA